MNLQFDSDIKTLLCEHYKKYPHMQIADVLKLLYQNEFGCEHFVEDEDGALDAICDEVDGLGEKACVVDPVEYIGNGFCRLYLSVLKQTSLTAETLCRFFSLTADRSTGSGDGYEGKVRAFVRLCEDHTFPFDASEVLLKLEESRALGYPPQRHSQRYRLEYAPAYRVVSKVFCDFLPLFCAIDGLMSSNERVVLAIDGNSAAGKSSLASLLDSVYSCNVFSMDDFFLHPSQKTAQRLGVPGGNVDYERFADEVLSPLMLGNSVSYRAYDCRTQKMSSPLDVAPAVLNVVEGVYSLHPHFGDVYDLKVFLRVDPTEQSRRLLARNPGLYDSFVQEWIPLENMYFDTFGVSEKCDFVFRSDEHKQYVVERD
jgi:hypothetical protein